MGFQNENGRRMCFDIETYPLDDAAQYLIEPIDAPSNYRDPAKIEAYIAGAKAEQLSRCALDPDLCRIVAIGVIDQGDLDPNVSLVQEDDDEVDLLTWFWDNARDRHLVGFNCLAFDLPVLFRRSLYLGVKAPHLQIDKYRHPEVTDLQMVLSFNGAFRMHGLSFYAARFGVEDKDSMTGADIGKAVAEGRWEDVRNHCLADVTKTAAIAEKCGLFRAPVGAF